MAGTRSIPPNSKMMTRISRFLQASYMNGAQLFNGSACHAQGSGGGRNPILLAIPEVGTGEGHLSTFIWRRPHLSEFPFLFLDGLGGEQWEGLGYTFRGHSSALGITESFHAIHSQLWLRFLDSSKETFSTVLEVAKSSTPGLECATELDTSAEVSVPIVTIVYTKLALTGIRQVLILERWLRRNFGIHL
ncbi:hypothetical protein BDW75DRAFT_122818 [Aspergillus navahoensis]